ncbi:MAG: PASTA domain-containing protein, partial [Nocardioidaceae bacterium]
GPELVTVPDVFGRARDDAIAVLEGAGLAVDVQNSSGYVGFDVVSQQSPAASEQVPAGSTVTIYLY